MDNRLYLTNDELAMATEIYESKASSPEEMLKVIKKAKEKQIYAACITESHWRMNAFKDDVQVDNQRLLDLIRFSRSIACRKIMDYYKYPSEHKWFMLNQYLQKHKAYKKSTRTDAFWYSPVGYLFQNTTYDIQTDINKRRKRLQEDTKKLNVSTEQFNNSCKGLELTPDMVQDFLNKATKGN